ncbi:hypothetical protein KGY73_09145 [bacterium]|nr:hypothetical protein [bacterium]
MAEQKNSEGLLVPCVYFDEPGPQNTQRTFQSASKRAEELDISNILVSSTSGKTGLEALSYFSKRNLVVVTHSTGFKKPGHQQLKSQNKKKLQEAGVNVLTCQHAFGGVGRAVRKKLGTYELEEVVAYTLRNFGEGTKVALEIVLMAADSGYISTQQPCISIGGTGSGVDTALLLKPAHTQNFFDLRVMEILAKPRFSMM